MATALFTQVNGDPTTTSGTFVDIPQLSFTLPAASAQWQAERGGTAHLGGSASISAVLVRI